VPISNDHDSDRDHLEWMRRHLDSIPVVTYVERPDPDHPLGYVEVYVSAQIESLLGYTPEEWVGNDDLSSWEDTIHPDDRAALDEAIARSQATGEDYAVEYRIRHNVTGAWVWVRDVARLVEVSGDPDPYWHGVIIDITRRKTLEEQIAYLAYHDSLTGLVNRKRLEEELELSLARAKRDGTSVALLFLDLNNFKRVNDTLGHDVGDGLLQEVAGRLEAAMRETDIVARQGGDEFLILISDIEQHGHNDSFELDGSRAEHVVAELGGRIEASLARPCQVGDHIVTTSASIGASIFPQDATDARTLLKHADMAMYAVKRSTRRRGLMIASTVVPPEAASA
jgi:diguanylate cyclase (GGDEF)-like protein/PAS domain S-box-containing protein